MFDFIYVEEELLDHPRVKKIQNRFSSSSFITCKRYSEVFNRKAQNFRLQKNNPALILAKKHGRFVIPTPPSYSIGTPLNFYFSHLLNCPYDCGYCFLQGMYRSAHLVIFVNYEDFQEEITSILHHYPTQKATFFAGYDGDSLALEPITHFTEEFIPFFKKHPNALFELRTKSVHIAPFLNCDPLSHCIIAYSLNPPQVAQSFETGAPSSQMRLNALYKLQQKGWKVGLRFDPVIPVKSFAQTYQDFFKEVFSRVELELLHSVTLGSFRLPKPIFDQMAKQTPFHPLLASCTINQNGASHCLEADLLSFCYQELLKYAPKEKLFCYS
jgi:spore photoproduct lyase